jgi:mono/diheme cytochrome c family protein
MKALALATAFAALPAAAAAQASTPPSDPHTALVRQYCTGCHSERGKAGGLSLASFELSKATDRDSAVSEKMIRKLRAGMMPPAGARRPDDAALQALAEALETRVDAAAAAKPNPGWRPFQRLNRAEYSRAVKDLLDVDIDASPFLPPDQISSGFDNIADSQSF